MKRAWMVVVAGVLGCHETVTPEARPTAVKVAVVEKATSGANTRYTAQINPATHIDLAFRVGGNVESVATAPGVDGKPRPLQEGDRVHPNMQLAAIRKTDYAQKVAEAQAAVAQAKAQLDQVELDYRRTAKLAESNAVAGAELDAARTRRDGAAAALSGARARADQALTALADTVLRSPLDGIVMKRNIESGQLASPGMIAFSVADVGSVKAAFGVPDTVLPRIRLGAVQSITTEAYPNVTFEGRISLIAPSADPRSRVFEVDVTIPNADGRLKPGSVASLSLEGAAVAESEPLVPLSAVIRSPRAGHFGVFVVEDSGGKMVARARDVELGEYLGKVIPVKKGLAGGEQIVIQGAGLLSDGEVVEVVR